MFIKWIKIQIWFVQTLGFNVQVRNAQALTMINNRYRIIEQSLSFHFLGKFWKCCSITQCFLSLLQTNISKYLQINQRISQKAPCQGLINFYQLHMTMHYQSFDDVWEVRGVFLNPIQDGLFRGCSRMGRGGKGSPSLKSVTHILQWWNLAQLYLT